MEEIEPWQRDMACAFNHGRECLARFLPACLCRRMPPWLYLEELARCRGERAPTTAEEGHEG